MQLLSILRVQSRSRAKLTSGTDDIFARAADHRYSQKLMMKSKFILVLWTSQTSSVRTMSYGSGVVKTGCRPCQPNTTIPATGKTKAQYESRQRRDSRFAPSRRLYSKVKTCKVSASRPPTLSAGTRRDPQFHLRCHNRCHRFRQRVFRQVKSPVC